MYTSTSCRSCPTGCSACSSSSYCTSCSTGYKLSGATCSKTSSGRTVGGAVGGGIAAVVFVGIIVFGVMACQKKKKNAQSSSITVQPNTQNGIVMPMTHNSHSMVVNNQNETAPLWNNNNAKPMGYQPQQPPMQNMTINGQQPNDRQGNQNPIGYGQAPHFGPSPQGPIFLSGNPPQNGQQGQLPPGFI